MAQPRPAGAPDQDAARLEAEQAWVRRAQAGERAAFDALMRSTMGLLHGMIGGLVWDPDDRADLVQETFYRAYKALDRFDPEARFRPWLITIAMNAARDHLRARRRRTMVSLNEADEDETPLELTDPGPRPDEEAIGRVAAETCEGAFRTLPEAARVILWLRVREELSYDEIAQVLDVPTGTVMSRLSRARTALRRALAEGSAEGTDREVQQDVADCRPDTAAERRAPGASP